MSCPTLSVVVPARDEAENLPVLLARIDRALAGVCSYEVILVDDSSADATASVAADLSRWYPLELVYRDAPPGKGYALLDGFAGSRGEIVCMIDADLQYPPEAIPAMVALVRSGSADVVVANRVRQRAAVLRRLVSWAAYLLLQALHRLDVDVQSGLKVIRRNTLDHVELHPTAWAIDIELLVRARAAGYVIAGHDVDFDRRRAGRTKLQLGRATWQILRTALDLKLVLTDRANPWWTGTARRAPRRPAAAGRARYDTKAGRARCRPATPGGRAATGRTSPPDRAPDRPATNLPSEAGSHVHPVPKA
jgi:glycosyltransferase involved in cell wall biosynthesis